MSQTVIRFRLHLIFVIAALATAAFLLTSHLQRARAIAQEEAPTAVQLASVLHRVHLDANALAAAGASADDAAEAVNAGFLWLNDNRAALRLADDMYGDAKSAHDALRRLVQSGTASEEDINLLPIAAGTLDQARTARDNFLDELTAVATADLAPEVRAKLDQIAANRHLKLPDEFLVTEREEEDWLTIRNALAAQRIAARLEEDVDRAATDYLAGVQSEPAVADALASLAMNQAAVDQAWNSATGLDNIVPDTPE